MKSRIKIMFWWFVAGLIVMDNLLLYTPLSDGMARYVLEKPYPPQKDVIPDGETAKKVAEAIFDNYYDNSDAYKGKHFTGQGEMNARSQAAFNKDENTWTVYYLPVSSEAGDVSGGKGLPEITMKKDNGKVVSIGLSE